MGVIGDMGDIVEKVQFFDMTQSFPWVYMGDTIEKVQFFDHNSTYGPPSSIGGGRTCPNSDVCAWSLR